MSEQGSEEPGVGGIDARFYLKAFYLGVGIFALCEAISLLGAFLTPVSTLGSRAIDALGHPTFLVSSACWLFAGGICGLLFVAATDQVERGRAPGLLVIWNWFSRVALPTCAVIVATFGARGGWLSTQIGSNLPVNIVAPNASDWEVGAAVLFLVLFSVKERLFGRNSYQPEPIIFLTGFLVGGIGFVVVAYWLGVIDHTAWYALTAGSACAAVAHVLLVERVPLPEPPTKTGGFFRFRVKAGSAGQVLQKTAARVAIITSAFYEYVGAILLMGAAYWVCRSFDTVLTTYHGPALTYLVTIPGSVLLWSAVALFCGYWSLSCLWSGTVMLLAGIAAEKPPVPTSDDPGRSRKATREEAASRGFLEA